MLQSNPSTHKALHSSQHRASRRAESSGSAEECRTALSVLRVQPPPHPTAPECGEKGEKRNNTARGMALSAPAGWEAWHVGDVGLMPEGPQA